MASEALEAAAKAISDSRVCEVEEPEPPTVSDGFGNEWYACSPTCDIQVVRPGKVQCSCE